MATALAVAVAAESEHCPEDSEPFAGSVHFHSVLFSVP